MYMSEYVLYVNSLNTIPIIHLFIANCCFASM